MTIQYRHEEFVQTTSERAFAVIDDLPRTADWLPPCVSLEKVGDGPNAVGDKLRYIFKQGGREAQMAGEILGAFPANACTASTLTTCLRCRSTCEWSRRQMAR